MQTAISTFDDRATAQQAVDWLVAAGFPRDDIHIEGGGDADSARTAHTAGAQESHEDRGVLASIGHIFTSLFGMDTPDNDGHSYTEAVRRGHAVVVVGVDSEEESERAVAIMNELGAVDMDKRSQQWRAAGWNPGARDTPARELRGNDAMGGGTSREQVQEEFDVSNRQADRGRVRVIQRVSEKPVRELIKLREKRAMVERRDLDVQGTRRERALASDEPGTLRETTRTERDVDAEPSDRSDKPVQGDR